MATTAGAARSYPRSPAAICFAIEAWTDRYGTWQRGLLLKSEAGLDVTLDAREGRELLDELNPRDPKARQVISNARRQFDRTLSVDALTSDELLRTVFESEARPDLICSVPVPVVADRPRARAGAWYEMVPRSQGTMPGRHGTFDDCIARLPDIAALGFDVIYLTPIHPIGTTIARAATMP